MVVIWWLHLYEEFLIPRLLQSFICNEKYLLRKWEKTIFLYLPDWVLNTYINSSIIENVY